MSRSPESQHLMDLTKELMDKEHPALTGLFDRSDFIECLEEIIQDQLGDNPFLKMMGQRAEAGARLNMLKVMTVSISLALAGLMTNKEGVKVDA